MHNSINDIKSDLKELCNEYVSMLEKLKQQGIISTEVFENCTSYKSVFIEEDIF